MTEPTAPSMIALIVQNWLDYQEAERAREGLPTDDDTCLMCPPVWPARGALKKWVSGLKEADEEIVGLRDDVARLHSDKMRFFEALIEMRCRDDRNWSLHENYRKIIDDALAANKQRSTT
jgi:hypothetical protein